MAIPEADVASQQVHYTQNELIEALENLSKADFVRLRNIARQFYFGLDEDVMDIVQESIKRVLSGRRPWPKSVPFINFMAGVIKSIADYENIRGKVDGTPIVSTESSCLTDDTSDSLIENYSSNNDSIVEREKIATEQLINIESLFSDDEHALAVIMGRADGYTPTEIQTMFDMTETQYDSAVRKIRRRLTKFKDAQ